MDTKPLEISDDALKILVAEHGVRGTARMLGMSEQQTHAFRQRATRGKWLQDPAMAALRARNQVSAANVPKPIVAAVSPQQAIAHEISALGLQSRVGFAKASAKVAEHIAERDAQENLMDAANVKSAAQTADLVFGWKDAAPQIKIRLDVLNGSAESQPIDIEATEIESISVSPVDDYDLDSY